MPFQPITVLLAFTNPQHNTLADLPLSKTGYCLKSIVLEVYGERAWIIQNWSLRIKGSQAVVFQIK